MKKSKRLRGKRITVTLPQELYDDFKERALNTGLSMSRLVYLRLKKSGNMVLVPRYVLDELKQLNKIFRRIESEGMINANDRELLMSVIELESKISFDIKTTYVFGK